jgi:rRNA processing protein Krr1/Pno1
VIESPKNMVRRVIGRGGETIKGLQHHSGARIQIDQTDNSCKVSVTGAPHAISKAVRMITDIVNGGSAAQFSFNNIVAQQPMYMKPLRMQRLLNWTAVESRVGRVACEIELLADWCGRGWLQVGTVRLWAIRHTGVIRLRGMAHRATVILRQRTEATGGGRPGATTTMRTQHTMVSNRRTIPTRTPLTTGSTTHSRRRLLRRGGGTSAAPTLAAGAGEWQALQDGEGRTYYDHSTTGVSQWEKPEGMH